MKREKIEEHIMNLNTEMGIVQAKCNALWKMMSLLLTLQAGIFILILSYVLM